MARLLLAVLLSLLLETAARAQAPPAVCLGAGSGYWGCYEPNTAPNRLNTVPTATPAGPRVTTFAQIFGQMQPSDLPPVLGSLLAAATAYPNPLQFASPADWPGILAGTHDAQPMVAAAIAAAGGALLPCGRFRFDSPLPPLATDGGMLRGVSRGCVRLETNFSSGDFITVGQPAGTPGLGAFNNDVGDFSITTLVPHVSGAAIRVGTHYDAILSRFSIDGDWGTSWSFPATTPGRPP